jgi:chemotaxis protein MotA
MDPISPIVFVLAWAAIAAFQAMEGSSVAILFSIAAPMILVFGVTLAIAAFGNTAADLAILPKAVKKALLAKKPPSKVDTITALAQLATVRIRGGVVELEKQLATITDPFTRRGVELIAEGLDSERLRDILEAEIDAMEARHKVAQNFFAQAGGYAPTIGIMGTVMSMVHILGNLSDPSALGHAIAAAFLVTFWGLASANLLWLPLNQKLKRLTALEVEHRSLIVEAMVELQAGGTARMLTERLKTNLTAKEREALAGPGEVS